MKKLLPAGLIAGALFAAPFLGSVSAAVAAGPIYVSNGTDPAPDATCLAAIATHPSIQSAVTDATDGDTIVVCPGTYAESVNDNGKSLTFQGARQGQDARAGGSGSETTVDNSATGGATGFSLSGEASSIDGFTLTGSTATSDTPAAFLNGANEQVLNTILTGNSTASIIVADGATFRHNRVRSSTTGTNDGGFFFNSGTGSGSVVDANNFAGDFENSAVNVADSPALDGLTITGNTVDTTAGDNFAVLGGTRNVTISGNTVTGGPNSGTGILLLGDDAGYTITGNTITGLNASAVSLTGGFGYPNNGSGTISGNAFKNNLRGINVFQSTTGTVSAHYNILVGNSGSAIQNSSSAFVNATENYYGCNAGPNGVGCDAVLGSVTSSPFLVLSTMVADNTLTVGQTTNFRADLNHDSNGDLVPGRVLDNVETASFTFTNGTVNPTTAPIVGGIADTTLTAQTVGAGTATAKVENSTSSKSVTVSAAAGKPSLRISDASTVEGNSGTHVIKFAVRLSKAATSTVTVRYTTADGSAMAGTDYVAKTGTLTFAPGERSKSISVTVKGDRVKEPSESFFVTLSRVSTNATIADPNGSGIIQNDD